MSDSAHADAEMIRSAAVGDFQAILAKAYADAKARASNDAPDTDE